jgi:hypothetical protein
MDSARRALGAALVGVLASSLLASSDAHACGGCFIPAESPESSVVIAHRMALAISNQQTVLWDQIQYAGSPSEFVWVLPVKPGARIEVASDAWFDTLEAATATRVNAPELDCSQGATGSSRGCSGPSNSVGCAASEMEGGPQGKAPPDPVSVVHHGSTGPYEAVVLHSDVPGALPDWLDDNGYEIPLDVEPIIEAYAAEKFDFVVLRLLPAQGIQQMRPVRVIQPGAVPTLPLRMVAAGTGPSTAITLFVIGEVRWTIENFPVTRVDSTFLLWDFPNNKSNYSLLRQSALEAHEGRAWLTPYAQPNALLSRVIDPVLDTVTPYQVGSGLFTTVGEAFVEQAMLTGETSSRTCADVFRAHAQSASRVVDLCDEEGACEPLHLGEIDSRDFMCAPPIGSDLPLDDLAVALTGMHPKDVWVTRLEATLPRAALGKDLVLAPATEQVVKPGAIQATLGVDPPCPIKIQEPDLLSSKHGDSPSPYAVALGALGVIAIGRRRIRRAGAGRGRDEVQP